MIRTAAAATLWQQCLARPDDDATREVLADLLQSSGDTRGELMALQLLPADPADAPARRDRIRAILREYGNAWLGPLRDLACGARFERGFVTRLELVTPPWTGTDRRWELDDEELASVEELIPSGCGPVVYHRVVTSPRLTNLRRMELHDAASITALVETPLAIRHVACCIGMRGEEPALVDRAFAAIAACETIGSVGVWGHLLPSAMGKRWFERLSSLTVGCSVRHGLELWSRLPAHMSLVISPSPALDTCHQTYPWDSRLELGRDGVARVSGEWLLQSLDLLLELPPDITRLELEDTSEPIIERIRRAVVGRRVDIAFRGQIGRAGNLRWA